MITIPHPFLFPHTESSITTRVSDKRIFEMAFEYFCGAIQQLAARRQIAPIRDLVKAMRWTIEAAQSHPNLQHKDQLAYAWVPSEQRILTLLLNPFFELDVPNHEAEYHLMKAADDEYWSVAYSHLDEA